MVWPRMAMGAGVLLSGLIGVSAWAQPLDGRAELIAARGERVEVRVDGGTTQAGTLVRSGPDWLELSVREEVRRLSLAGVQRVERVEHDSLVNGTLIGLAAGLAGGLAFTLAECGTIRTDDECSVIVLGAVALPVAGAAAGVGALIDHAISRRTTIFSREGQRVRLRTAVNVRPQRATLGVTLTY